MFKANRLMVLSDDEGVLVHWNGKEIAFMVECWDALYAFEKIVNKINIDTKPITYINIDMSEIDISEEAWPLLYSVKQFTQVEELAFVNKDWKALDALLIQRIEDGEEE